MANKTLQDPLFPICVDKQSKYFDILKRLSDRKVKSDPDGLLVSTIGTDTYWEHTDHKANPKISSFSIRAVNPPCEVSPNLSSATSATDLKPNRNLKINYTKIFPKTCYVTPASYSNESAKIKNNIASQNEQFIFLDCGRWLGQHRDFGVIFGRHVYLCSYDDGVKDCHGASTCDCENPNQRLDKNDLPMMAGFRDGLDKLFFQEMIKNGKSDANIKIVSWAIADWGDDDDFDWNIIHVVIPDLHLKAAPIAKIWSQTDKYEMHAEKSLLTFTDSLLKISLVTTKQIQVIQIGDSYDLWVGHGFPERGKNESFNPIYPLFKEDEDNEIIEIEELKEEFFYWNEFFNNGLKIRDKIITFDFLYIPNNKKNNGNKEIYPLKGFKDSYDYLYNAIRHIRGEVGNWIKEFDNGKYNLNPAEQAFRNLQAELGEKNMIYIYGNHDNYLICDDLYEYIVKQDERNGIKNKKGSKSANVFFKRMECHENKSLFIEHAHRMESLLPMFRKSNFDGTWNGFKNTNRLFWELKKNKFLNTDGEALEMLKNGADESFAGIQLYNNFYKMFEMMINPLSDIETPMAISDQVTYIYEFAKFKLGRKGKCEKGKLAPNIFVIGHTHCPTLKCYEIKIMRGPADVPQDCSDSRASEPLSVQPSSFQPTPSAHPTPSPNPTPPDDSQLPDESDITNITYQNPFGNDNAVSVYGN